jgi:hypothetical protein
MAFGAWPGQARQGTAWRGRAWHGEAGICFVELRARRGEARHGATGEERWGTVRRGRI